MIDVGHAEHLQEGELLRKLLDAPRNIEASLRHIQSEDPGLIKGDGRIRHEGLAGARRVIPVQQASTLFALFYDSAALGREFMAMPPTGDHCEALVLFDSKDVLHDLRSVIQSLRGTEQDHIGLGFSGIETLGAQTILQQLPQEHAQSIRLLQG
jgi:hypothetical protein